MLTSTRIRLQQIIREAEGYLELALLFDDQFDTSLAKRLIVPRALDALKRVKDSGGLRGHAFYLEGEALRTLGRYEEAISPLTSAAELDPENIHIWLALGWCYKRSGRLDLAIESLEKALDADHGNGLVYYNLACYWSLAKNKSRALECLSQALNYNPDFRDLVGSEPDFDPLRNDPDFQAMTSALA